MSQTPDPTPPTSEAPQPEEHGFFASIRRMGMARTADRWIGGVSGAIARRLGVDPLVVRALFVASVFFAGIGFVLYGLAWALLPEESDGRIHAQEAGRGNADAALLGAAGFVLVGLVSGDGRWTLAGWWNSAGLGWINGLLWLAVIGVVVAIVVNGARMSTSSPPSGTPSGATPPPPAPAYRSSTSTETPVSTFAPPAPGFAAPPPPPPAPARPPRPTVPPVPGAGPRFFAVCAGLSILVLAGLLLFRRAGLFDGPLALTALGATSVIFGLGIIVAGLRGRSSGVLGFIAVMSILLSFPAALAADVHLGSWRAVDNWKGLGSTTFTPTEPSELEGGFAVGLGDLVVDLSGLELTEGEPVDLTVQVGTGSAELRLPEDESVRVDVSIGAGEVRWDLEGSEGTSSGAGVQRTVTNSLYSADEDPDITVYVNVGLGDIDITQEH